MARPTATLEQHALYLDEQGASLGTPGIVTTFVHGKQMLVSIDPLRWARTLATTLAKIHAVPFDADEQHLLDANTEAIWFLRAGSVPDFMHAHPAGSNVWHAVRALLPSLRSVRPTLVHLDYAPHNILWDEEQLTAVLDWEEAAYGDPAIDVAYLRMHLCTTGQEQAANECLDVYQAAVGHPVENLGFWELAAAVRQMPDAAHWLPERLALGYADCNAESLRQSLAHFIASAKRRAGV